MSKTRWATLATCLTVLLWAAGAPLSATACAYPSTHEIQPRTTAAFIEAACLPINTAEPVEIELSDRVAFHWHHCVVYPSRLVSARRSDQAIWYEWSTCCLEERGPDLEWHRIACAKIRSGFLSTRIDRTAYGAVPILVEEPLPDDLVEQLKARSVDISLFDLTIRDIRGDFEWDRSEMPF